MNQRSLAVLGAGSWGTALACLVARNGFRVHLWGHDAARLADMDAARENRRFLAGLRFPDGVLMEPILTKAMTGRSVLVAVPSHAFRETLIQAAPALGAALGAVPGAVPGESTVLAWATKGLERDSGKLMSEVAAEVLGTGVNTAVISGPTFAIEVARGMPTAFTVASGDEATAETVASWLRSDRVRAYTCSDPTGVQLGGAIKNAIAIAAGISDGLGFGANARAALVTRGLAELVRLGVALGGVKETFMGLAGLGDLVLTATDDHSRNRRLGLALGRGQSLAEALEALGQEAEGVSTARELVRLARGHGIEMPIVEQVARVLFEGVAPRDAVEALLKREPRREH